MKNRVQEQKKLLPELPVKKIPVNAGIIYKKRNKKSKLPRSFCYWHKVIRIINPIKKPRISKFETNSNDRNSNDQNEKNPKA
jgi:hypothetical protein